jgi:2-isopropylmalate synthase
VQRRTDSEGGEVSPENLWKIFEDEYLPGAEKTWGRFALDGLLQSSHLHEDVQLIVELQDAGSSHTLSGSGSGPIAALVVILNSYLDGTEVRVLDYVEHALAAGGDAKAAAYLECDVGGRVFWGVGIDPSTTRAALKAVVSAVNRGLR